MPHIRSLELRAEKVRFKHLDFVALVFRLRHWNQTGNLHSEISTDRTLDDVGAARHVTYW